MSVKEIRELDNGVREVSDAGDSEIENKESVGEGIWERQDFVSEDEEVEEKEEKEFSIGDTMLARGDVIENWGSESLEESVDWEEVEEFGDDDDFGGDEFSYDVTEESSGGDLYGTVSGSFDLYGASGQGGKGPGDVYNTGPDSSLYNGAVVGQKKNSGGAVYNIEGQKKKKGKRREVRSGLEGISVKKKTRRRGASIL